MIKPDYDMRPFWIGVLFYVIVVLLAVIYLSK